jgi:hypothetical protein
MLQDTYTMCVNGELNTGDLVLSTPDDDYACLVGRVLEIHKLGTPEHDAETDNDTDDVHVNFMDAEYSDKRIAEIEAMFSDLYGQKKEFGECPIDDAIMSPDALVRINGIEPEKLSAILDSYDNAAAFCKSAFRVRELTDRLTANLSDYRDALLGEDKQDIMDRAGEISAMTDTHYYLTENHEFEDSEVDYLLLFENPLEVVADKWNERVGQMDDFCFALNEVFDKQNALQGGYALYAPPVPPEPSPDGIVNIKQAARYEAERLLFEIKSLKQPNHPDNIQYMATVSPEFIKQAGFEYDKLLFDMFKPVMPMTFAGDGKGGITLSMRGDTRAVVKVVKPSIMEQLREGAEKAAKQTTAQRTERGHSDPSR